MKRRYSESPYGKLRIKKEKEKRNEKKTLYRLYI